MNKTIEALNWRYAVKKYDPTKKLSDEQRGIIMESLRLAPSSFGLQPYAFVHVTDPALREKLKPVAYNQPQITDASDLFILCAKTSIDEAYVDSFVDLNSQTGGKPHEELAPLKAMLWGSVSGRNDAQNTEWSAKQVYIALGVAIAAAAENHIDVNPMEGFDSKAFDEILGLAQKGLTSKVVLAAGFRASDDKYATMAKVRFPKEKLFIEM